MYIKHALSKQHAWLAVVMAIAACLFFLPFATKAYADGTFEITDWLSGYGYSDAPPQVHVHQHWYNPLCIVSL